MGLQKHSPGVRSHEVCGCKHTPWKRHGFCSPPEVRGRCTRMQEFHHGHVHRAAELASACAEQMRARVDQMQAAPRENTSVLQVQLAKMEEWSAQAAKLQAESTAKLGDGLMALANSIQQLVAARAPPEALVIKPINLSLL
jgi:hypothetical protein